MDTLRGAFDSDIPADDSPDWGTDTSAVEEENVRELPPEAIGQDERRMQVRAYNHWASLLGEATFPNIEDLEPENLHDFGPNSVLLDFSGGIDDPVVQFLGPKLGEECGASGVIERLSDVPPRSLLSRITDHYMQILANQAPIGFEAEFVNQRGQAILYRGILLPFSSDDETIDFIYGVINWKEMADAATADELLLEIDQAIGGTDDGSAHAGEDGAPIVEDQPHKHHVDPLTEWADSPAYETAPSDDQPFELELELDNVAAFSGEDDAEAEAGEDALPMPDFGNFSYDDELYNQFGDEDEEEDEDDSTYSFASLSDYIEAPAKKVVDLDADRFDPEDYRVEDPVAEGPVFGQDAFAGEDADEGEEEAIEAFAEPVADADDAFDLAGLEVEEASAQPPEFGEEFAADEDEPVAQRAEVEDHAPREDYAPNDEIVEPAASVEIAPVPAQDDDVAEPVAAEADDDASAESGLYDCLASARELAQSARVSEDRSRQALYAAVGRAYDVSIAAGEEPEAYEELIADCGLTVQDRAPMTPIVKLVFGHDYDKTRLTEYAAVLSHAHRLGLERGSLAGYLAAADGGLKGVVSAERRLRREEAGEEVETEGDVRAALARKLRELDEILLQALDGQGPEFSLVMVRRNEDGKAVLIGEIADDVAMIERAGKLLVG